VFEHRYFREIVPVYSENVCTIMCRLVRMECILVFIKVVHVFIVVLKRLNADE